MSDAKPTVLITGGTGLTGSAIIEAMTNVKIVSLTRHGAEGWSERSPQGRRSAAGVLPASHGHVVPASTGRDDVVHLAGDITRPRFGLGESDYERLGHDIDFVLHAAGVSDYTMPRQTTEQVNVGGTREVVDFANRAGRPLYHVSTGYVRAQGAAPSDRWGAGVYIDSKRRAEEVLEHSSTLAAVIRPSIVFGDSRSGWSPSFQGLHRFIGMMLEEKIPLLPFDAGVRADFLPRDVIGRTVADLVATGFRGEYWLAAGAAALTFGRIVELLCEYGQTLGRDLHPPRFVTQEMIDRLLKPAGGSAVARRIDLLVAITGHFVSTPELPSSLPDAAKGDLEAALINGARYWASQQGLVSLPDAA